MRCLMHTKCLGNVNWTKILWRQTNDEEKKNNNFHLLCRAEITAEWTRTWQVSTTLIAVLCWTFIPPLQTSWAADVITSVFNLLLCLGGEVSSLLTANRVISACLCAAARRLRFSTHSFAGCRQVSALLSSSFTLPAAWIRTGGLSG